MAIITVPITYVDGVDVVHGQDITDTQETAIDAEEKANRAIVNVALNDTTGVFTFTRGNGATFTLDTLLEKVVTNFTYDSTTQELVLTLEDGTTQRIPMSAFIDVYTGVDGDMITVSVSSGNAISAVIKDGTITKAKLVSAVQTSLGKADTALQPTDVVDNLTSTATTAPLSANQGKQLNDNKQNKIDSSHKLSADLTEDGTTNKVFTATEKTKLAGLSNYTLPQADGSNLGGVKADPKTSSDTQEVHIDPTTGKLYTQPSGGGGSSTIIRRWS